MQGLSLGCRVILQKNKPYMAMIFIQFVYAGMALLSKAAISKGMNPYVFVVYRQAFASIALSPFAIFDSKQATSLSHTLLCKIFLISLFGLTLSSSLYYVSISYTTATFAAASTNTVPAITFIMAVILRVESLSVKHMYGMAKILGAVLSLSGAIIFALVKGPPLEFMKWYPQNQVHHSSISLTKSHSKLDVIKGPIMMLSANTAWSLWLILQGFIVKQYTAKFRLTTLQCLFSCMQSAVLAVVVERDPSAWKLGWDINLLAVTYCGVIVTGICYWLQVCTIETKGPVFTAMFTPLALIITAIFSALLWKESLYWGSVGGALLLAAGLYSVLWGKSRECPKQESHHQDDDEEDMSDSKLEDTTLECIIKH